MVLVLPFGIQPTELALGEEVAWFHAALGCAAEASHSQECPAGLKVNKPVHCGVLSAAQFSPTRLLSL